jgi:8-oxo-dGTP diphosphatase
MQSEQQYLSQYDPSQFEHPSVTVDILLFTIKDRKLQLLLIKRKEHPFIGKWALPGGFLRMEESADEAAARRIREETGVENIHLEQLYTFSSVNRDPRTRVLSIAYLATVPFGKLRFQAGEGADEAGLFAVDGVQGESVTARPEKELSATAGTLVLTGAEGEVITGSDLAFDHEKIIRTAVQRMRGKLGYTDLAFGFVEDLSSFTLTELRIIHEAILDRSLDIGNFRRTIKREYEATCRIRERGLEKGAVGRPAMLYQFDKASMRDLTAPF